MNEILLLMGLLVLSYIGSFLVGGHVLRGFGLPSGVEVVMLGFLIGPSALGLLEQPALQVFEPVANVALGWLTFVIGINFGYRKGRRIRVSRIFLGAALAIFTGVFVALAVWVLAIQLTLPLQRSDRILISLGVGAVTAETTRHAVLWVVQRHKAEGKLSNLIADITESNELAPIFMIGIVFSFAPAFEAPWPLPIWVWTIATAAIGLVLGLIAVVLLGSDFRLIESWSVLLGTCLFAIGMTVRIGLSSLLATFMMGTTIAFLSRHRREILAMVAPTERAVVLPALMLAGAHVHLQISPILLWIVAVALGVRIATKLLSGVLLVNLASSSPRSGPLVGVGLLSSGAIAISVGLTFALRFPGQVGDTVLLVATVTAILGEFVGPAGLRAALRRAGEIRTSGQPDKQQSLQRQPAKS